MIAAPYALLTFAILALWIGGSTVSPFWRFFWVAPFAASLFAALATDIVRPVGLVWIGGLAVATWAFGRSHATPWQRVTASLVIVTLAAGLMLHQLPGFNNPRVISSVSFSAGAIPYRLHLNFDKTLTGLFLLGFCHSRIVSALQWRVMAGSAAPIAAGLIVLVMLLSLGTGYVRFAPKFPTGTWLWLWVNLCFTCVAEEAFFRGFVQSNLQRLWQNLSHGRGLALLAAAVLFGLAHTAGGAAYVALATVAGIGYGWAYLKTGRIEASILTHFVLNAVHFFGFTYPALQPAT